MSATDRKSALLALVEDERARQCRAILDSADARATALRAEAHAAARARVRDALAAARERRASAIAAAEARRQTRTRLARQGQASALLTAAWTALPAELERRWRHAPSRRLWIESAVARAVQGIEGGPGWTVRHALGAEDAEMRAALAAMPPPVARSIDPALRAGLRISRGGNVLDASLDGLLADRDAVAAALLAAIGGPA